MIGEHICFSPNICRKKNISSFFEGSKDPDIFEEHTLTETGKQL